MKSLGPAGCIEAFMKNGASPTKQARCLVGFALYPRDLGRMKKRVRILFEVTRRYPVGKISKRNKSTGPKKFVPPFGNKAGRFLKFLCVEQKRKRLFPSPMLEKDAAYPRAFERQAFF